MQNFSVYPDQLSVMSRALLCFFPTTFLETSVNQVYALSKTEEIVSSVANKTTAFVIERSYWIYTT